MLFSAKNKHKGFTLIELLVVISIIALLMAIMMPALGRAREMAKTLSCKANVRSLNTALLTYVTSNNDRTFLHYSDIVFFGPLAPYLGDVDEVRYCPNATKLHETHRWGTEKHAWRWSGTDRHGNPVDEKGSYAFNGFLYDNSASDVYFKKAETAFPATRGGLGSWYNPFSAIKNGSQVPSFVDGIWPDTWPYHTDNPPASLNYTLTETSWTDNLGAYNQSIRRISVPRHKEAVNVSFVDGHAETVDLPDLWKLKWCRSFKSRTDVKIQK